MTAFSVLTEPLVSATVVTGSLGDVGLFVVVVGGLVVVVVFTVVVVGPVDPGVSVVSSRGQSDFKVQAMARVIGLAPPLHKLPKSS